MFVGIGIGIPASAISQGGAKLDALKALSLASTRPIDVVGLGDSNELYTGIGFDHGLAKALATRYGLYASPIYIQESGGGTGQSTQGFCTSAPASTTNSAASGAPAQLEALALPPGCGFAASYCYQTSGDMGTANGITVNFVTPGLDVNANLRGHFCYGTFNSGAGQLRPGIRREGSPFTILAQAALISTNTGAFSRQIATVDLPAAVRDFDLGFKWRLASGTVSAGPSLEFWSRVENRDRLTGISFNTLYGVGGTSLYDQAEYILGLTDAALTNYFQAVRHIQAQRGHDPIVVMYINSGINDRVETSQPSLGPAPSTVANSPEAYIDNLNAVRNRIEAIYALNGWSLSGLFWLIVPSHRISDPQDPKIVSYASAAQAWAQQKPRTSVVRLDLLTTYAQKFGLTHYAGTNQDNPVHQLQAGYEFDGAKIVEQIL